MTASHDGSSAEYHRLKFRSDGGDIEHTPSSPSFSRLQPTSPASHRASRAGYHRLTSCSDAVCIEHIPSTPSHGRLGPTPALSHHATSQEYHRLKSRSDGSGIEHIPSSPSYSRVLSPPAYDPPPPKRICPRPPAVEHDSSGATVHSPMSVFAHESEDVVRTWRSSQRTTRCEPLIRFPGRTYTGSPEDYDDLAQDFDVPFTSTFSVAFTACWHKFQKYSRIIDFGSGPRAGNIFVCNKKKEGTLSFHVFAGKKEHSLEIRNLIKLGSTHRYLCRVNSSGHMSVFQNGEMVGEQQGGAPLPGKRDFLFVGKSNWHWDDPFCGSISDLWVWNAVVDWADADCPVADLAKSPTQAAAHEHTDAVVGNPIIHAKPKSAAKRIASKKSYVQKKSRASSQETLADLESAARLGEPKAYAEILAHCVELDARFDVRFLCKLLVLQMRHVSPTLTDTVRLTLNTAVSKDGQVLPIRPPNSSRRWRADLMQEVREPEMHTPSSADAFFFDRALSASANQPSGQIPLDSLRGFVQFDNSQTARYVGHFITLLHLETLTELEELALRLQRAPTQLIQQGVMVTGLQLTKVSPEQTKKKTSSLPGKGGKLKKSRLVFSLPKHVNLSRLRLQLGDSVLLCLTDTSEDLSEEGLLDLSGEGKVVKIPNGEFGDNELVVVMDGVVDQSFVLNGFWRLDKGPKRVVYERQLTSLLRLATAGRRRAIWELLLMTGVGGSNLDVWAAQMQQKIQGQLTNTPEEVPDVSMEEEGETTVRPLLPHLKYDGRKFNGIDEFEDLSDMVDDDIVFGPNFSVAFTACWNSFRRWSRILDLGNGEGDYNIFIGNLGTTSTFVFHFWAEDREYKLHVPGAIQLGVACRYLCSIDETRCMRAYQDGRLIGEQQIAEPLPAYPRVNLLVAKSHWDRDELFHGEIKDLRAWDALVDCNGVRVGYNVQPTATLEYEGRSFAGASGDFEDLGQLFRDVCFSDAISIRFTACWTCLNDWSRIIDFGNGPDDCNIFIANRGRTGTFAFHILSGKREHKVQINDAIKPNQTNHYLCTASTDGHMRVFQDGKLIGENLAGAAPTAGPRKFLYVAKSNWNRDASFSGTITDLKVWNVVLDGAEHAEDLRCEIKDPVERLKVMSAEEPSRPAGDKAKLQGVMSTFEQSEDNSLNPSQRQAIANAIRRRLTLVQGPPGTGKTHVAVRLLELLSKEMHIKPLLAASDSNIAVDNIAEGAQTRGLNVVRVGRPEKITPQLESITLQAILRTQNEPGSNQSENADGAQDWGDKRGRPDDFEAKMKILKAADVICCTNVASGSDFFQAIHFGAILIDEAAQATELSALVPIVLRGAEQLVLVGDHAQLPPSVASVEAELRGLSLSLFGRLAAQGLECFFLNTQFRMHPMIAAFSAQEFYHGKLLTGVSEAERLPPKGFFWPTPMTGIAFVQVSGSAEGSDGQSKYNEQEALKVTEILVNLLNGGELALKDIGVVSPYSAQVSALRQRLRDELGRRFNLPWNRTSAFSLEVASVDAFQGREKEVIIFSAVRNNKFGNVGFLADWRRLNVMITRARRGLIIVGDARTLEADATWRRWLEWALANGFRSP